VGPNYQPLAGLPDGLTRKGIAEYKAIACNYTESTKIASVGAIAYVARGNPGNGHERIPIVARSRGGRWIYKWESIRRLDNFRLKTVMPGTPLERHLYNKAAMTAQTADDGELLAELISAKAQTTSTN
jgi:hypothetical protein